MFNFHSAAKQNVSYGILGTDRFGYTLVEELAESGWLQGRNQQI